MYFLEEEVLCQLLQARLGAGDDPRDVAGLAPDALGLVKLLLRQFLFHSRKYVFIINGDGHVALVAVDVCFALRAPVDKVVIDPAAGFGTISGFPRRGTRIR